MYVVIMSLLIVACCMLVQFIGRILYANNHVSVKYTVVVVVIVGVVLIKITFHSVARRTKFKKKYNFFREIMRHVIKHNAPVHSYCVVVIIIVFCSIIISYIINKRYLSGNTTFNKSKLSQLFFFKF